jgi:flavin reductase (DIM6/NTAB) family NADH-FMN oxidoreductase RutF
MQPSVSKLRGRRENSPRGLRAGLRAASHVTMAAPPHPGAAPWNNGTMKPDSVSEPAAARMTAKADLELARATQPLGHGPVTLITSARDGRANVMAASWAMPLDFDPPKVIVIMDARTLTRELVMASGEFGLQLPTRAIAAQTLAAGSVSGRDRDKFAAFGIRSFPARRIAAPMVEGCAVWLECRVIPDASQRMDIVLGEVIAAYSDPAIYSENRWHFGPDPLDRTIHYVAGGSFFATGEPFQIDAPAA